MALKDFVDAELSVSIAKPDGPPKRRDEWIGHRVRLESGVLGPITTLGIDCIQVENENEDRRYAYWFSNGEIAEWLPPIGENTRSVLAEAEERGMKKYGYSPHGAPNGGGECPVSGCTGRGQPSGSPYCEEHRPAGAAAHALVPGTGLTEPQYETLRQQVRAEVERAFAERLQTARECGDRARRRANMLSDKCGDLETRNAELVRENRALLDENRRLRRAGERRGGRR